MRLFLLHLLFLTTGFLAACSSDDSTVQGYIDGDLMYMSSNASGVLKMLAIKRGDNVSANQILFNLDPEPEVSQLQSNTAKLSEEKENLENLVLGQRSTVLEGITAQHEQAQADFLYAEQTLARYQQLYGQGAISKDQLDQATSNYKAKQEAVAQYSANLAEAKLGSRQHVISAQQAAVDAAMADVTQTRWQLEQKTISSPKDGEIFDTFYKVGEYVPAGQAVCAVLSPDNIKLLFYISEPRLSQLKLGSQVAFKCDHCSTHYATVNYISPNAEYTPPIIYSQTSRAKLVYRVEATIPPEESVLFHPGQPVDVFLTFKHAP